MIVGASGTLVNEALLYFLRPILGFILAQAFGVEVSIINNFIWNDSFTFRQMRKDIGGKNQRSKLYRLLKYNLLSIGTFTLNLITYTILLFELGQRWYILASLVAILVAFVFNYLGSSRWAWKRTEINTAKIKSRIPHYHVKCQVLTNNNDVKKKMWKSWSLGEDKQPYQTRYARD